MAAVTASHSAGAPGRGRPGPAAGGGDGSAETWKRHIVRQLKHRDRNQHHLFQDLIRFYSRLLEKSSLAKGILSCSTRRPSCDSVSSLLQQNNLLRTTTGELAYQVVELQQQIKTKECFLEEQHARLLQVERRWAGASDARRELQVRVERVREENGALKVAYDGLLELQGAAETRLREEKVRGGHLLEDMIHLKQQAAARMNSRNERRSRAREANLQRELQSAARSKVAVDSSSAPTSRSTSPKDGDEPASTERGHARLFRSASATSPRILTSIRGLFQKRRGHSVSSLEEDLVCPTGICLPARIPRRALQVLEAHEQGINTVRFSCSSDLLATGGTDRVIKLWEVRAGSLTHRGTLDGSTEGVTCVEFDPTGSRVLAASYDKSAMLWRLEESVPKLTLTGHSRKVTAARFSGLNQVVTGSADRTIRLWDLQRAACVQVCEVSSYCSDLVCSENCVISGHFDCNIRVWDTSNSSAQRAPPHLSLNQLMIDRSLSCFQELPVQGKVTSLDISSDQRQLLSCCRDDCLQLVDLRRRSSERMCFRAEGFKCGSDSTKAVIRSQHFTRMIKGGIIFCCCHDDSRIRMPLLTAASLAAGSADGAVYIWNVSTGSLETCLPAQHSSSISAVSWSLSGQYVVSVDKSRLAVLWSDI